MRPRDQTVGLVESCTLLEPDNGSSPKGHRQPNEKDLSGQSEIIS